MNINKFDILKDYCEWGWRLLPVHPKEKRPLIKKWTENASCDLTLVEQWANHVFKWANWGVLCGQSSGLIVIDLDKAKTENEIDGDIGLPQLEAELGTLPKTITQTTPSGGRHYFFKAPTDRVIKVEKGIRFFEGMAIDVLSEGRQVLISPSRRDDGDYEWIHSPWDTPLAELPQPWIERLSRKRHTSSTKKDTVISLSTVSQDQFTLPDEIGNGERNDTLFKYACSLLAKGESHDRVRELVLKADLERGNPPMQDDHQDYQELLNTIESAIKTDEAGREARIIETLNQAGMSADSEQVKGTLEWLKIIPKKDGTIEYDIHESNFIDWFVVKHQLINLNGMVYSVKTGGYMNDDLVSKMVQDVIRPYITKNLNTRVTSLFNSCKRHAYEEYEAPDEFTITLNNKSFKVERDGTFTDVPHVPTLFKFPIDYDPNAECPAWENFIKGLIPAHAIPTLQQYMGYCFIPSNRSQVSLHLIGKGKEGKSKVLDIMKELLGKHNHMMGKVQTVFGGDDKFLAAQMVNRYVFMDDDLTDKPLKDSSMFKDWVTNRDVTVQRKGVDGYQVDQFIRIFCAGNFMLRALDDTSDAWYRRLVQIRVLPRPADRIDNRFLIDELKAELPGIFNWCMRGLSDLMKNGMELYTSDETLKLMFEQRRDDDPLLVFLESEDFITFDPTAQCTSNDLRLAYNKWASANGYKLFGTQRKFSQDMWERLDGREGVSKNDNVISHDGKRARGYNGIRIHYEKKDYANGKFVTFSR